MATLKIPKSPAYRANKARCNSSHYPCVVCGKPVKKVVYMVECVGGSADYCSAPYTADGSDPGYMGFYPVGRDCLKNHPELRPFVVEKVN